MKKITPSQARYKREILDAARMNPHIDTKLLREWQAAMQSLNALKAGYAPPPQTPDADHPQPEQSRQSIAKYILNRR